MQGADLSRVYIFNNNPDIRVQNLICTYPSSRPLSHEGHISLSSLLVLNDLCPYAIRMSVQGKTPSLPFVGCCDHLGRAPSSSSSEDDFAGWGDGDSGDGDDGDDDDDDEEELDDDTDDDGDGNVYDWTMMDTGGEKKNPKNSKTKIWRNETPMGSGITVCPQKR